MFQVFGMGRNFVCSQKRNVRVGRDGEHQDNKLSSYELAETEAACTEPAGLSTSLLFLWTLQCVSEWAFLFCALFGALFLLFVLSNSSVLVLFRFIISP